MIKNILPVDFDFNYSIWSRRGISESTENKFGIHITIHTIGYYLKSFLISLFKNQLKELIRGMKEK
jgi:hypothetical protein